jgi:hypothetical protein
MEDGTRRSLEEMDIEQEDLIEMLRAHRNRKKGPWFLRFLPKTIT